MMLLLPMLNMRLKTDIKPKEATFQVILDALALTPFYRAFLITADVPAIYMQEFWATFSVHKDLGHTGDITYLTDVNVDYLHQPWRAFATVINKCLSGKEIGMDKIRLSRAQILWGMFHKKNIDYEYLLWEDLLFHIENKDAKKTNKMSYPRFTKILINYFMAKDQSISRRNKMFWYTAQDDTVTIYILVTYTEVSSPFKDLSDIGSPGVDGLHMMPEDPYAYVVASFQAPPSPDYVPGPEEPEQAPPSPEFVPEPVYLEFMPPEDEVFLAEEQPLRAAVSPTTDSPGYIADSDLEEDLEEDPTDYPAYGGNDDDDDDESSDDDEDDDDDVEEDEDEKEEEEHPTLADSVPPPVHHVTARMSVRAQTPISLPLDTEILSPPLPVSSPPLPVSPTYPLGYRAAMIWMRAETPSTSHPLPSSIPPSGTPPLLPIPLPTPSPPMLLPSTVCRAGVSEVTLLPQKRLCIALGLRYKVSKSSSAPTARPTGRFRADYGFVGTLDDKIRRDPERERLLMSDQLNMLRRDRHTYARTARLMETEAKLSREAWVQSLDASDTTRSEVRAL
ncbi:hypothetical protein Tco_1400438 [Tanacetum coccineum]